MAAWWCRGQVWIGCTQGSISDRQGGGLGAVFTLFDMRCRVSELLRMPTWSPTCTISSVMQRFSGWTALSHWTCSFSGCFNSCGLGKAKALSMKPGPGTY